MNKNNYRQGDVDIKEIDVLPIGLRVVNNPILKLGEMTGHHHKLVKERESQFEVMEDISGNKYLKINEPTDLVHQEHSTITIEKGLYWVGSEQEYNYFENSIKRVQD